MVVVVAQATSTAPGPPRRPHPGVRRDGPGRTGRPLGPRR